MNKKEKMLLIELIGSLESDTTRSKKKNLRSIAKLKKIIQADQEEKDANTQIYLSIFFAFLFGIFVGLMINDNTPMTAEEYNEIDRDELYQ
jgi:hypothetical protein